MQFFKLQFGCLVFVLYISIIYIKETIKNYKCNKIFDCIIAVVPWAIIFDGLTAWTVNHLDTVPSGLNLLFHGLFFVSMTICISLIYLYIKDQTTGISNKKSKYFFNLLPGLVSIILTAATLPKLYYVDGKITNYSMGIPVYVTYIFSLYYLCMIFLQLIVYGKSMDRHKRESMLVFTVMSALIFIIQVIFPESLVTSLFSTLLIVGIYVNNEDPFITKNKEYNKIMVADFATLVENRDNSTGGHIKRTQKYVELILTEMKKKPKYQKLLTKDYMTNVSESAPLHDIGKISTPDYILQKPGKLTPEEFKIIQEHAYNGGEVIKQMFRGIENQDFLKIASEVARYHHEKWNGKGYPERLKTTQIPLHARIMAVADVFDAISAKRCYRDAIPLDKCFEIIQNGSGIDFDPEIVEIFIDSKDKVLEVFHSEYNE